MIEFNQPLQSEEIGELAKALCAAQSEISGAVKDSNNPFFNSQYADLNSVTNAIKEAAHKNNLSYSQTNIPDEKGVTVVTTLMHTSGQWIRGFLHLPASKVDPQGFGSAMTYARRYGLAAIFGVVQEDDDGNEATKKTNEKKHTFDGYKKEIGKAKTAGEAQSIKNEYAKHASGWSVDEKNEANMIYEGKIAEFENA